MTQTIYEGVNQAVLSVVPATAFRILDVGCGTGTFGECLREQRERYIVGITYSEQEAKLASVRLNEVHCADLNHFDFSQLGKFDCVVLSHILEHLYRPGEVLERLKCVLGPQSVIVVALPNVVWWKQRLEFLLGNWRYTDWGILDRTHFRFFDQRSSAELLQSAGYEIIRQVNDGRFPLLKPIRRYIGSWAERVDQLTSTSMPGLFAIQFIYLAKMRNAD